MKMRLQPLPLSLPIVALLLATALACPIARPPVPQEYYDFRADLIVAVEDTTVATIAEHPDMQARLDSRLPDLSAILTTDSLIATLDGDPVLWTLAGPVAATLRQTLEADGVGGRVRSSFRNADGQRLAVDAIIIGFGKALRRLRREAGDEGRSRESG